MTPEELNRFRTDLEVILSAKVPIEFGSHERSIPSRRKSLSLLNRYCSAAQAKFQANSSATANQSDQEHSAGERLSPSDLNGLVPDRFQAALQTYQITGSMTPVLDGLTVRGLGKQQLRRLLRWPILYLSIVLLMCTCGLYFYWNRVLPHIQNFRLDLAPPRAPTGWDYQTWLPSLYLAFSVIAVLFMLCLLLGGFYRLLLWLGGKRYLDSISAAMAQRLIPIFLQAGASLEQTIPICYRLVGLDEKTHSKYFPTYRSLGAESWFQGAEYWKLIGDLQMVRLNLIFPTLAVSLIGGLLLIIYAVCLYGPLVALIKALPYAGT